MLLFVAAPLLFSALTAQAQAPPNATITAPSMCQAYIDCMEAVRIKSDSCQISPQLRRTVQDAAPECADASTKHDQLRAFMRQKLVTEEQCVASKIATAKETSRNKGRCGKLNKRLAAGEAVFGVRQPNRRGEGPKGKPGKNSVPPQKAAARECHQAVGAMRQECRALHRCCPLSNQCRQRPNMAQHDELKKKKKEMKDAIKKCRAASKKNQQAAKQAQPPLA